MYQCNYVFYTSLLSIYVNILLKTLCVLFALLINLHSVKAFELSDVITFDVVLFKTCISFTFAYYNYKTHY